MLSQQSDTNSTNSDKCFIMGSGGRYCNLRGAYGVYLVEVKAKNQNQCVLQGEVDQEFRVGENSQRRVLRRFEPEMG